MRLGLDHRIQQIFMMSQRVTIYIIPLAWVMIMLRDGVLLMVPICLQA